MVKTFRTKAQNRHLWVVVSKFPARMKPTRDDLHSMAFEISDGRTESTSRLYKNEFDQLIDSLILKLPENVRKSLEQKSKRTTQYHRQKAGVVNIDVRKQWKHIQKLWAKHNRSKSGLEKLCRRMLKGKPKPTTTKEGNAITEAVKSMNKREEEKPPPTPGTAARVA